MKTYTFTIDTGYPTAKHVITDEFDDDVTEEELQEYAKELINSYISCNYEYS